jgi:hypothetical protein
MMKIFEGMWANDLEDLIQPLVSIDEYESKIDNTAIAVGFYVNDKDGADDLNRFIQKSSVPIIDSDVSPAPDQRGYYIVFAELSDNDRFIDNLRNLCEEVAQLGAISKWNIKIRGLEEVYPFNEKLITKIMVKNKLSDRMEGIKNSLKMIKTKLSSEKSPHR